jgi:hypothetical protein
MLLICNFAYSKEYDSEFLNIGTPAKLNGKSLVCPGFYYPNFDKGNLGNISGSYITRLLNDKNNQDLLRNSVIIHPQMINKLSLRYWENNPPLRAYILTPKDNSFERFSNDEKLAFLIGLYKSNEDDIKNKSTFYSESTGIVYPDKFENYYDMKVEIFNFISKDSSRKLSLKSDRGRTNFHEIALGNPLNFSELNSNTELSFNNFTKLKTNGYYYGWNPLAKIIGGNLVFAECVKNKILEKTISTFYIESEDKYGNKERNFFFLIEYQELLLIPDK